MAEASRSKVFFRRIKDEKLDGCHKKFNHADAVWTVFYNAYISLPCSLLVAERPWRTWSVEYYIPGFFFGLGGSFMVAYKLYLKVMEDQKRSQRKNPKKSSFNRHI